MRGELLRRHVIQTAAGTFVIVFVAPGDAASPAIQITQRGGMSQSIATPQRGDYPDGLARGLISAARRADPRVCPS